MPVDVVYIMNMCCCRELSLRKGDIVYLLRAVDENWFEGEHHGLVGRFPVSYVEARVDLTYTPSRCYKGLVINCTASIAKSACFIRNVASNQGLGSKRKVKVWAHSETEGIREGEGVDGLGERCKLP